MRETDFGRIEDALKRVRNERAALKTKLAALDARESDLEAAKRVFIDLFKDTAPSTNGRHEDTAPASITDAAVQAVEAASEPQSIDAILGHVVAELGDTLDQNRDKVKHSLRGILSGLVNDGRIRRAYRGHYAPIIAEAQKNSPETADTAPGVAGPDPSSDEQGGMSL